MSEIINNFPNNFIRVQGKLERNICCEKCNYETGYMKVSNAVYKVNMHGGYYMFDGDGGAETKCPICGLDSLVTLD